MNNKESILKECDGILSEIEEFSPAVRQNLGCVISPYGDLAMIDALTAAVDLNASVVALVRKITELLTLRE